MIRDDMAKPIYFAATSLDGYIEGETGTFDVAAPDDEIHLLLSPILLGGGTPALPTGLRHPLTLIDQRQSAAGTVYLRYRVAG